MDSKLSSASLDALASDSIRNPNALTVSLSVPPDTALCYVSTPISGVCTPHSASASDTHPLHFAVAHAAATPPARSAFRDFVSVSEMSPEWKLLAPQVALPISRIRRLIARAHLTLSLACLVLYVTAGLMAWIEIDQTFALLPHISPLTNFDVRKAWQVLFNMALTAAVVNLLLSNLLLSKRLTAPILFVCPCLSLVFSAVSLHYFRREADALEAVYTVEGSGFFFGCAATLPPVLLVITLVVGLLKEKRCHEHGGVWEGTKGFFYFALYSERSARFQEAHPLVSSTISRIRRKTAILYIIAAVMSYGIILVSSLTTWMNAKYSFLWDKPFPTVAPLVFSGGLDSWQILGILTFVFSIVTLIMGIVLLVRWASIVHLFVFPITTIGLSIATIIVFKIQTKDIANKAGYYDYGTTTELGYTLAVAGIASQVVLMAIAGVGVYNESSAYIDAPSIYGMGKKA